MVADSAAMALLTEAGRESCRTAGDHDPLPPLMC